MRTRLVLAVFALMSFSFPAYAATGPIMPTYDCNDLGASHMSDDRLGLVICALTTASYAPTVTCGTGGGCKWKLMSSTLPPVCNGPDQALQSDGSTFSCATKPSCYLEMANGCQNANVTGYVNRGQFFAAGWGDMVPFMVTLCCPS